MSNHTYRLMQYHQRLDDELRSEVRGGKGPQVA